MLVPKPRDTAKRCVKGILKDLCDRSGLQNAWDEIDEDIQREIQEEWVSIIAIELGEDMEQNDD